MWIGPIDTQIRAPPTLVPSPGTNGAISALSGLRTETEELIRERLDHLVATMRLVTREDYEVVQAMATRARDEQEALLVRVAALEAKVAALDTGKKK